LSLCVLDPDARTACEALAVFPEDTPVSVPILSDPQLDLLALARRYKERADYLDRRVRYRQQRGGS
jgi:hypothetical protein